MEFSFFSYATCFDHNFGHHQALNEHISGIFHRKKLKVQSLGGMFTYQVLLKSVTGSNVSVCVCVCVCVCGGGGFCTMLSEASFLTVHFLDKSAYWGCTMPIHLPAHIFDL
jgi:hypothetical protein